MGDGGVGGVGGGAARARSRARALLNRPGDDSEDCRLLLRKMLETRGFTVRTAATGRQALVQIEACRPDVVLRDVMMPDMTGHEVLGPDCDLFGRLRMELQKFSQGWDAASIRTKISGVRASMAYPLLVKGT